MITVNMLSRADQVKGQGVLSAHDELIHLVKERLSDEIELKENQWQSCMVNHFHTINPEFYLMLAFFKRRGQAVGYVHFLPETLENSIQLPRFAKKIFYRYVLSFYKRMDHLIVVNPYFIKRLAHYGVPEEKVTYIPNFVSEEQFYPIPDKRACRHELGLKEAPFTVLCVGQLQLRKGVFDFLETARALPDVAFVWAGDSVFGKLSDGYAKIQEAVAHAPENVKFLGLMDRERMNLVYNAADVMFLPSFEELFPMTVLEAMSCGIPLLLRDLDIYPAILFDYYLKGANVKAFVSVLEALKDDTEYYRRACACSAKGSRFYSRAHVAQMWRTFYTKIAQERR